MAEAVCSPPRTRPAVHGGATGVALHHDAVERALHLGKQVICRDQRRVHPQLHPAGLPPRQPQQLDAVAQRLRAHAVGGGECCNAFGVHLGVAQRHAKGHCGQQREFVCGVVTMDVEGRVGLGVAQCLGLGQRRVERQALRAHGTQDEVAGAVDDAGQPLDVVAAQTLAQRLDDGDADGHCPLERHHPAMALGGLEHEVTLLGQQRLVGRHHVFAVGQCGQHPIQRGAGAAHGLDHHVHIRVGGHRMGIGQHLYVRANQGLGPCHVACGHLGDHHVPSGAPGDGMVVAAQNSQGARTHGSQAQQPDA
jgi:hypothetical protein